MYAVVICQSLNYLMTAILNNILPWDGTHLGVYTLPIVDIVTSGVTYYRGITLPNGIIYCTTVRTQDLFACIVEDIKPLFGLTRRGIHRITLNGFEYLLYYVPISLKNEIIWETPLNHLDARHELRKDPKFRAQVQRMIAFCDIMALCGTTESHIGIRPAANREYVLINTNETNTHIKKDTQYDYSIITKTLFAKWFGEDTSIHDVVKCMLHHTGNVNITASKLRSEIQNIIKKYDNNLIWYAAFIVDRASRHLLA